MTRSTFAIPAIIAAASIAGLLIALTGDGFPDAIAGTALATPMIAIFWAIAARRS